MQIVFPNTKYVEVCVCHVHWDMVTGRFYPENNVVSKQNGYGTLFSEVTGEHYVDGGTQQRAGNWILS